MGTNEDCSNEWIYMLPKDCVMNKLEGGIKSENLNVDSTSLSVLTLKHPCTGEPSKFLFNDKLKQLYEINSHRDKYGSWFVDAKVQQDGSLFVATIIDPLYIVLPYLNNSGQAEKYVILDQILKDEKYSDCNKFVKILSKSQMENVAEVSGTGDFVGFKYSQEKTLEWLSKKVKNTVNAVTSSGIFIADNCDDKENEDEIQLEYAFRFVESYLNEDIASLLQKHLNIRKRAEKRHSMEHGNQLTAKKIKNEKESHGEAKNKKAKVSKAQRDLNKVNKKGMKSISSFFSPSSKK
ncbi:ribonuclease H2 subunit B-like [Styela clava]|uniref:ribonuclease H2 subunit B-like n=1 Tax=Styela clava TaxID=7725 RepID=UPI001939E991|nr:ribonuclease H2 subunit B-like [Styela clava]